MTYDQLFHWCFLHQVDMQFRMTPGGPEVTLMRSGGYGEPEVLGRGKNVLAAIQDAIQVMRKQEVSA